MHRNDDRLNMTARRVFPLAIVTILGCATLDQGAELPKLATEVAFPKLSFDRPVALAYPADKSNLLYVVEQHQARIWSFLDDPNTADKQLFLQLPDKIHRGNEEGLLGMAFHPKYKENGRFYVYYSADDDGNSPVRRLRVQGLQGRPSQSRSQK